MACNHELKESILTELSLYNYVHEKKISLVKRLTLKDQFDHNFDQYKN